MATFRYHNGCVSPIKSGMARAQVRSTLGDFNEFRKSKFSENSTDDFINSFVHAFYRENDIIKGLEIFSDSEFIVFERNLFEMSAREAKSFFEKNGADVNCNDIGFNVESLNIRIYAPEMMDEEDAKIKSIYIEI